MNDIDLDKLNRLRLAADIEAASLRSVSDLYITQRLQRDDLRNVVLQSLSRDAGRKWEANGHDPYELLMLEADEQKRIGVSVPTVHALVASTDRLAALALRADQLRALHAPFAQMVARFNTYAEGRA